MIRPFCRAISRSRGPIALRWSLPGITSQPLVATYASKPDSHQTVDNYFITPHSLSPYFTDILYDSSIGVSADTIEDKTASFKNTVDGFLQDPQSFNARSDLVNLFLSLRKRLSADEFSEFLVSAYFMLVGQHVSQGNSEKAVQTHRYLTSLDPKLVPEINRSRWLTFVKSILSRYGLESSDALFIIHRLQPNSITKQMFGVLSSWLNTLDNINPTISQSWVLRLLFSGDIPCDPWETTFFHYLVSDTCHSNLSPSHKSQLYRLLIRNSRNDKIDFVKLGQLGVLKSMITITNNIGYPDGFNYLTCLSHAMLSSPRLKVKVRKNTKDGIPDIHERYIHSIVSSFWHNVVHNNDQIPIGDIINYFNKNNFLLPPTISQKLVMRSKSFAEFQEFYELVYHKSFSTFFTVPSVYEEEYPDLTRIIHSGRSLPAEIPRNLTPKVYSHSVRLLCAEGPKMADEIMESEISYNSLDMVYGYLEGLSSAREFEKIIKYCETFVQKSDNPHVLRAFWRFYIDALLQSRHVKAAVFYMVCILQTKLEVGSRKKGSKIPEKVPEQVKYTHTEMLKVRLENYTNEILSGASLPNSVFENALLRMMRLGRTDISQKNTQLRVEREMPYTPKQILAVLQLGFDASCMSGIMYKIFDRSLVVDRPVPYQISPARFKHYLQQVQSRQVILNREEFMDLIAGIIQIYPNYHMIVRGDSYPDVPDAVIGLEEVPSIKESATKQNKWKIYPPGTYFSVSYFNNTTIELMIYIGILLCPPKIWWILAYIRYLSRTLSVPVDQTHIKEIMTSAISQIYSDVPVAGELSRVRHQTISDLSLSNLMNFLNLVWNDTPLEVVDSMLDKKGIHRHKTVANQMTEFIQKKRNKTKFDTLQQWATFLEDDKKPPL